MMQFGSDSEMTLYCSWGLIQMHLVIHEKVIYGTDQQAIRL